MLWCLRALDVRDKHGQSDHPKPRRCGALPWSLRYKRQLPALNVLMRRHLQVNSRHLQVPNFCRHPPWAADTIVFEAALSLVDCLKSRRSILRTWSTRWMGIFRKPVKTKKKMLLSQQILVWRNYLLIIARLGSSETWRGRRSSVRRTAPLYFKNIVSKTSNSFMVFRPI
jgi:hypothetical protein